MFISNCDFDWDTLKESTLIIPSISLGNVPQLTVDLFIETFDIPRVGFWDTTTIIPVIGSSAYSNLVDFEGQQQKTSFNGEIYYDKNKKVTFLQFRAPIGQGLMNNFVSELTEVVIKYAFKNVLVLSSYDMTLRIDSQIQNSQIRWLCNEPSLKPTISLPEEILKLEFEVKRNEYSIEDTPASQDEIPSLPGSGFTRKFLMLAHQKSLNQITALFSFVSEGDNRNDALLFADNLSKICDLNTETTSWKAPPSWDSLFGSEVPLEMYN